MEARGLRINGCFKDGGGGGTEIERWWNGGAVEEEVNLVLSLSYQKFHINVLEALK